MVTGDAIKRAGMIAQGGQGFLNPFNIVVNLVFLLVVQGGNRLLNRLGQRHPDQTDIFGDRDQLVAAIGNHGGVPDEGGPQQQIQPAGDQEGNST